MHLNSLKSYLLTQNSKFINYTECSVKNNKGCASLPIFQTLCIGKISENYT